MQIRDNNLKPSTKNKMTLDEFTEIIETHGSEPQRWPTQLRQICQDFLEGNDEAGKLVSQYRQLHAQLDRLQVPAFPELESRVLQQALPSQVNSRNSVFDRLLLWLLPDNPLGKQFWQPAMAACLPLVFGIILGNYFSFGVGLEVDELEYWEDELAMLSLNDYTENSF